MVSIILISEGKRHEMLKRAIRSAEIAMRNFADATGEDPELICRPGENTRGVNFNNSLMDATCEFVKILDDDDELTPNCLIDLVAGIGKAPWCVSDAINVNDVTGKESVYRSRVPMCAQVLAEHNSIHGGTTLYRTDALRDVAGMDIGLITAEEYDLHLCLLSNDYYPIYVDAISYIYHMHPGSKSNQGGPNPRGFANREERTAYVRRIANRYK